MPLLLADSFIFRCVSVLHTQPKIFFCDMVTCDKNVTTCYGWCGTTTINELTPTGLNATVATGIRQRQSSQTNVPLRRRHHSSTHACCASLATHAGHLAIARLIARTTAATAHEKNSANRRRRRGAAYTPDKRNPLQTIESDVLFTSTVCMRIVTLACTTANDRSR